MIVSYQVPKAAEEWPWPAMFSNYFIIRFQCLILDDTKSSFLKYSVLIGGKFGSLISVFGSLLINSFHFGSLTSHRLKQTLKMTNVNKKYLYGAYEKFSLLFKISCVKFSAKSAFISLPKYSPVFDQEGVKTCTLMCLRVQKKLR